MQLKNMSTLFLGGAVLLLFVVSTPAKPVDTATPDAEYNVSDMMAAEVQRSRAIRPRDPQPGERFDCEDYSCTAQKTIQTTIGANCVTVCQLNCNVMVNAAKNSAQIGGCSIDNKPMVSAANALVLWQGTDALCGCKYCKCSCAYDIDNIDRPSVLGCAPTVLCRVVPGYTAGYTFSSWTISRRYSCRFPPASNPNSPKQPTSPKSPKAIEASRQD
ncbi:hypothetical protein CTRI78_v000944 [Colletotrichum trifolii]|uniref:Uncharacterized protein n=1 Tax=Colletotrichum trifolii TaxID=5466 RepID=A0A4R8RUT6_COLTR|nr:hypothetical protein CTRI78_v000944 [Colletotrichum trifolii]